MTQNTRVVGGTRVSSLAQMRGSLFFIQTRSSAIFSQTRGLIIFIQTRGSKLCFRCEGQSFLQTRGSESSSDAKVRIFWSNARLIQLWTSHFAPDSEPRVWLLTLSLAFRLLHMSFAFGLQLFDPCILVSSLWSSCSGFKSWSFAWWTLWGVFSISLTTCWALPWRSFWRRCFFG